MRHALIAALLLAAGCSSPRDPQVVPFTAAQRQQLLGRARPPQAFGLTPYSTELGPVFAGAHRLHQGDLALLPFLHDADPHAPVIEFESRGVKKLRALIDTSARESWIASATAAQIGLVALAGPAPYETKAAHVYDELGGWAGLVHNVQLDELRVENVVFHMRAAGGPLGPPARWLSEPSPDAVFGATFLRAFSYVQLDFPARRAMLAATLPAVAPEDPPPVAIVPLKDVRGALAVEGALDGEPMTFILDTGGDFGLVLNEPPAATVRRLSLGDLVFPADVPVVGSMDQGLGPINYPRIGRQLLSRYRVTLDFRNKRVLFERPARKPSS